MSFSKTLTITTDASITSAVSLLLTFDEIDPTVPNRNRVPWRVLNYGRPNQTETVIYEQSAMVCNAQIDSESVYASARQPLALGQKATLVPNGQAFTRTPPTAGPPGKFTGIDNSGGWQSPGAGFFEAPSTPNAFVWKSVGDMDSVQVQFTPILRAYAATQYQQTELIRGEVISPVLWTQNLTLLPNAITDLTLSQDSSGEYFLTISQPEQAGSRIAGKVAT